MSAFHTHLSSPSAAINWIDLRATGEVLVGNLDGHFFIRASQASRVAIGVTDPGTSNSAGIVMVANETVEIMLGIVAAAQTIWVQTPADESEVYFDIENAGSSPVLAVL